jgi:uncharacterized membrane protein
MKTLKKILQWIFGVGMILAGINHFLNPTFYLRMMPPFLPTHLFLIYLSGVFEIVLGIFLLIPKFIRLAAYALIALLIAVFPANIYMTMNPQHFPEFSLNALFLRLPLQLILIGVLFWLAREKP